MKRRGLLKSVGAVSIGSTVGISEIFGTVAAEEVTSDELDRLEAEPDVRKILSELGEDGLPDPTKSEKRLVGDDASLTLIKIRFEYGTLTLGEYDGDVGAAFSFDEENLSKAPEQYRAIPRTDASLVVIDGDVTFRRVATEKEEDLVLSAVDVEDEITTKTVYTGTDIDGFRADIRTNVPESGGRGATSYLVEGGFLNTFDSKQEAIEGSPPSTASSALTVTPVETGTDGVESQVVASTLKRILIDWVEGYIATNISERVGPCGPSCTGCADWLISLALECRTCGPVCTAGATPLGAITCVLCVYAFCNDVLNMVDCARCGVCIKEGEAPDDPRDDIWDAFPSPPSLP